MNEYLKKLNDQNELNHALKEQLRQYAAINHVPIINKDSLDMIIGLLKMMNKPRILEIGTAIGYSSICFADYASSIVTIERDIKMKEEAIKNINEASLNDKINLIFDDALKIDEKTLGKFDVIFIDAAKAQYLNFFNKYSPLLNDDGIIITDNILFHGNVENQENLTKNVLSMVKKIDNYNHFLALNPSFSTTFVNIGDGIAITKRK